MENKQREPLKQCCKTCPFLLENADKPNPNGWTPGPGEQDWFKLGSLDSLWKGGLSHGEFMMCHSSDPNAAKYGGSDKIQPGHEAVCMGAFLQQYKHVKTFNHFADQNPEKPNKTYQLYKRFAGKAAMTRRGIFEFVFQFLLGRTDLVGGLPLPKNHSETRPMRLPTGDKIELVNGEPKV